MKHKRLFWAQFNDLREATVASTGTLEKVDKARQNIFFVDLSTALTMLSHDLVVLTKPNGVIDIAESSYAPPTQF